MSSVESKSRNAERYEILGEQSVMLTIEAEDHRSEPLSLMARLLNLSASGAKLSVPMELPRDRTVSMKLAIDELGLSFYLSTRVCWSAPAGEQTCIVGCQLSPNVPEGILKHVSRGGKLDRRDDDRRPVSCEVSVSRKALFRTKEDWGDLVNYAPGGICLETRSPAKLGEQLSIQFDKSKHLPSVEVIVRWQMQQDDKYLLGCEYVDVSSFTLLSSVLA